MNKNYKANKFLILLMSMMLSFGVYAEKKEEKVTAESKEEPKKEEDKKEKKKLIEDIVKDFEKKEGFFITYLDPKKGKTYLEINEDQLDKDIIYFAHIMNGVASLGVKGSFIDNGVLKAEKTYESIKLTRINTNFQFKENDQLAKSKGSNVSDSVIAVIPIKAKNEDENSFLVDITGLLLSESLTSLKPISSPDSGPSFRWGGISPKKSSIRGIFNYPQNTDFEVDYVFENPPSRYYEEEDAADYRNITVSVRYSFIQPPKNNFIARIADQRVGYFTTRVTDLSSKDVTPYRDLVERWHLEKADPEKEISPPVKPITFWLENTTPIELRDFIVEGVLAWNEAFLKAGFENAIEVKIQPDDADWDAGDIRYNVLRWTSSPNPPFGGYGPSFVNPRTGEILGADIMLEWVYLTNRINLKKLVPNKYMCSHGSLVQEGKLLADLINDDDPEVIKQSIIRLTLHEVGHTLGLNHNFKASHLHNATDIHNKEITSKLGLTSSVMEYPAVNLAPVGVKQGDYYDVKPGLYDQWAIEFGYRPDLDEDKRKALLERSDEPELMFANDADDMRRPGKGIDPRAMISDLSNEPIKHALQRIELMDEVQKTLLEEFEPETWEEYRNSITTILREKSRALSTASRFIGGIYVNRSTPEQKSDLSPYEVAPLELQIKAINLIKQYGFSDDAFYIQPEIMKVIQKERRGFDFYGEKEDFHYHEEVLDIQQNVLNHLLHPDVLSRIIDSSLYGEHYPLEVMFNDLTEAIFDTSNKEISGIKRNLQIDYTKRLLDILKARYHDEISASAALKELRKIEKLSKKSSTDLSLKNHREYLYWLIDKSINNN